jgi:hypothetical protein
MRSLLASVLVVLAGIVGTLALTGHVLASTVLDPDRPGRVLEALLDDPEHRREVTDALLSGWGVDDAGTRRKLDRVLDDPDVRSQVRDLRAGSQELVDVADLRSVVAAELERRGNPTAAERVLGAGAQQFPAIALPGRFTDVYGSAGDTARTVARLGALLAAALVATALVVATNRGAVAVRVGVAALVAVAGTLLLFLGLPWLVTTVDDSGWAATVADAVRGAGTAVVPSLVVVAAIGVGFVAVGMLWPRSLSGPGR